MAVRRSPRFAVPHEAGRTYRSCVSTPGVVPRKPGGCAGLKRLAVSLAPLTHFASASMTTRWAPADGPAQEGEAARIDSSKTRKMAGPRLLEFPSSGAPASMRSI